MVNSSSTTHRGVGGGLAITKPKKPKRSRSAASEVTKSHGDKIAVTKPRGGISFTKSYGDGDTIVAVQGYGGGDGITIQLSPPSPSLPLNVIKQ